VAALSLAERRTIWASLRVAVVVVAGAIVVALALAMFVPWPALSGYRSQPRPARSYGEALRRLRRMEAREPAMVLPACRTHGYVHGARTHDVLVFVHGLTNCPQQFDSLARRAAAHGANVLVVRLPHHGFANRMTGELGFLRARELAQVADESADVAAGLGEHVTFVGLSLGAVVAAWAGQERSEVERVMEIGPLFGVTLVPRFWTVALTRALIVLPNRFVWWDAHAREHLLGPPQVYPRFSTRALGETLRLGLEVRSRAQRQSPAVRELVLVNIEHDPAVNNGSSLEMASLWRKAGVRVQTYEFPASLHLSHDLIDPLQIGARIDLVYPVLEAFLDAPVQGAR
jgi:alpha-beta hydrolase superfamily lysophospholipase